MLCISERTVKNDWAFAKVWLQRGMAQTPARVGAAPTRVGRAPACAGAVLAGASGVAAVEKVRAAVTAGVVAGVGVCSAAGRGAVVAAGAQVVRVGREVTM